MTSTRYRNIEDRLLRMSALDEFTGCWPWVGRLNAKGYGCITMREPGKKLPQGKLAHRVAYEALRGIQIPEGMTLDHRCRRPPCINPMHMDVVSVSANRLRAAYAQGWGDAGCTPWPQVYRFDGAMSWDELMTYLREYEMGPPPAIGIAA